MDWAMETMSTGKVMQVLASMHGLGWKGEWMSNGWSISDKKRSAWACRHIPIPV